MSTSEYIPLSGYFSLNSSSPGKVLIPSLSETQILLLSLLNLNDNDIGTPLFSRINSDSVKTFPEKRTVQIVEIVLLPVPFSPARMTVSTAVPSGPQKIQLQILKSWMVYKLNTSYFIHIVYSNIFRNRI